MRAPAGRRQRRQRRQQQQQQQQQERTKYVVAARGSRLSLAQAGAVVGRLEETNPGTSYEITTITTRGDTDARPLFAIDQKGIFEKEVDRAVADGRADFAVHSMKDVPSELPDGLELACVPERERPEDVLITADGSTLEEMRPGAVIGTKQPEAGGPRSQGRAQTWWSSPSGETWRRG